MADVDAKVKKIISEQLGVPESDVKPEASFVNDLGADSLDTVELVMASRRSSGSRSPTRTPKRSPRSRTPSTTSRRRRSRDRSTNAVRSLDILKARDPSPARTGRALWLFGF